MRIAKDIGKFTFIIRPCREDWNKWFAIGPVGDDTRANRMMRGLVVSSKNHYTLFMWPKKKST